MASLGQTRYGVSMTFMDPNEATVSKSFAGINFTNDVPQTKATYVSMFVKGLVDEAQGKDFPGLVGLLSDGYTLGSVDLTARNQVTGTVID